MTSESLYLRIICLAPPSTERNGSPTEFGVVDKKHVILTGERDDSGAKRIEFSVAVKRRAEDESVRLAGQFVHGTSAEPFLYLGWRRVDSGSSEWIRRWKIVPPRISVELLNSLGAHGGRTLTIEASDLAKVWIPNPNWIPFTD